MNAATKHLCWMTGSAWVSAASAGVAAIADGRVTKWLFVFGAVFNGLWAIYWAMQTVVATIAIQRSDD